VSKKSCPFLYSEYNLKIGQDFLENSDKYMNFGFGLEEIKPGEIIKNFKYEIVFKIR